MRRSDKGFLFDLFVLIILWAMGGVAVLFILGCAPPVILYPIEKHDIYRLKAGECSAEVDGWFISDFYLEEVMQAKVKQ